MTIDTRPRHEGVGDASGPSYVAIPRWLATAWVVTAAVGIVAALGAGIAGVVFVDGASETSLEAVALTDEVLGQVDETAAVLDATLADVGATLGSTRESLDQATTTLDQVGTTLDDLTVLVTEDVPDSLDAVDGAMPQLIRTGAVIDSTFRALSFVGVDYDPDTPLDEALEELRAQLGDIAPELRAQREGFDAVADGLDGLVDQGAALADDVGGMATNLDDSRRLIEDYRVTAGEARAVVAQLPEDIEARAATARLVVVLLTLAIAASNVVGLTLGGWILRGSPAGDATART